MIHCGRENAVSSRVANLLYISMVFLWAAG